MEVEFPEVCPQLPSALAGIMTLNVLETCKDDWLVTCFVKPVEQGLKLPARMPMADSVGTGPQAQDPGRPSLCTAMEDGPGGGSLLVFTSELLDRLRVSSS